MNAIILHNGQFFLALLDDEWAVALSDPIPRGLVPLSPEERLSDWEALYDLPTRRLAVPIHCDDFEVVHHSEMF